MGWENELKDCHGQSLSDNSNNGIDTNKINISKFFDSPINNQSAVHCYEVEKGHSSVELESTLNKYLNEKSIAEMINVNSEIERILNKFKISIKINMNILNNLVQNHLSHTRSIALGIADCMPQDLRPQINKKALAEATSLHDIAKAIIPESIINKAGALDEHELEIMKEHAKLSYEMLKTTDLSEETLNLIKNHHYADENAMYNINLQILSIADVYSALREKRSYKAEMSMEQALDIIRKEVNEGKFLPSVFKALTEYAKTEDKLAKLNSKRKFFNFKFANGFCS